jgi:hypothetical protein
MSDQVQGWCDFLQEDFCFHAEGKAPYESREGDDRHFGVLREGSGSVVSVVSVVN